MTFDLAVRIERRQNKFTREMIMILMLHEEVLVQLNGETLNSSECKSVWLDLLKKIKEMY